MSFRLQPEQRLHVEHSVGGLLEDCSSEHIQLMLPLVYNIVYGEVLNDPMYKGHDVFTRIHGHTVLKILRNSPMMVTETLAGLDLMSSLAEMLNLEHSHTEEDQQQECESCTILNSNENLCLEIGEAIVKSMPYIPALRQFMEVEGNQLSVYFSDDYTVHVQCHGMESLAPLDRSFIDNESTESTVLDNPWGN